MQGAYVYIFMCIAVMMGISIPLAAFTYPCLQAVSSICIIVTQLLVMRGEIFACEKEHLRPFLVHVVSRTNDIVVCTSAIIISDDCSNLDTLCIPHCGSPTTPLESSSLFHYSVRVCSCLILLCSFPSFTSAPSFTPSACNSYMYVHTDRPYSTLLGLQERSCSSSSAAAPEMC